MAVHQSNSRGGGSVVSDDLFHFDGGLQVLGKWHAVGNNSGFKSDDGGLFGQCMLHFFAVFDGLARGGGGVLLEAVPKEWVGECSLVHCFAVLDGGLAGGGGAVHQIPHAVWGGGGVSGETISFHLKKWRESRARQRSAAGGRVRSRYLPS